MSPRVVAIGGSLVAFWAVAAVVGSVVDGSEGAPWWLLIVNHLLLAPLLVVAVISIGDRLVGRPLAAWPMLVVLAVPLLGIAYSQATFRTTYRETVLAPTLGLTDDARFASAALLIAAAASVLCSIDRDLRWALPGGVTLGVAAVAEPGAVTFLVGAALAYAVARQPRAAAAFIAAATPGLAVAAIVHGWPTVEISWSAFDGNMAGAREFLFSNRLLQWIPLAGAIGLARRSLALAVLALGWFAAFAMVYGASPNLSLEGGSYLPAFIPTWPVFALFVAALPLLVPTLPARLDERLAHRRV